MSLPGGESPFRLEFRALILPIRQESIRGAETVRGNEEKRRGGADLPPDIDELPAPNKRVALSLPDVCRFRILRIPACGRCGYSPRLRRLSGAYGIWNRELPQLPPTPWEGRGPSIVDTDAVVLRSTAFLTGWAFGKYIARIMKAVILLRQPAEWRDPESTSLSLGGLECAWPVLLPSELRPIRQFGQDTPDAQIGSVFRTDGVFVLPAPLQCVAWGDKLILADPTGRIAESPPPTSSERDGGCPGCRRFGSLRGKTFLVVEYQTRFYFTTAAPLVAPRQDCQPTAPTPHDLAAYCGSLPGRRSGLCRFPDRSLNWELRGSVAWGGYTHAGHFRRRCFRGNLREICSAIGHPPGQIAPLDGREIWAPARTSMRR